MKLREWLFWPILSTEKGFETFITEQGPGYETVSPVGL